MAEELFPGVFVDERPSAVKPVAGVSTTRVRALVAVALAIAAWATFSRRRRRPLKP
jgi:hypothetical protein